MDRFQIGLGDRRDVAEQRGGPHTGMIQNPPCVETPQTTDPNQSMETRRTIKHQKLTTARHPFDPHNDSADALAATGQASPAMRAPSPAPDMVWGRGRRRVCGALFFAGALMAMGMVYSLGGGQHADDESSGSRVLGSGGPAKLRRYEPSAVAAGQAPAGPWRRAKDPCAFLYPGPLRPESMDCFLDYFPAKLPFYQPVMAPERSFTLGGIQWERGPPPVPIFVLFKDRVSVLMETLRSFWRNIGTPYEVRGSIGLIE